MNLAISNIAWDSKEDEIIYKMMRKFKFKGLEIAPTRFFSENPYEIEIEDLIALKEQIANENLSIVALQSILFGRPELKMFETQRQREDLFEYLKKAVLFSCNLGANILVFGSPKNRISNDLNKDYDIAIDFFRQIGDYAAKYNAKICIEANPKEYNTNFINSTKEAFSFVKSVGSDGFGLHIDTSTMFINNEDLNFIEEVAEHISHFHISEPYLEVISKGRLDSYNKIARILKRNDYSKWISIEMKKASNESNIKIIEDSLSYVAEMFGG